MAAAKKTQGTITQEPGTDVQAGSIPEAAGPASGEIKVKIKLFKDNDKYKDDLVVGVNGTMYKIQRGVEVEVPLSVAEVIENSNRQDAETARKIAEAVERYRA